jgi:hypothetical protein
LDYFFPYLINTSLIASIRTKHEMAQKTQNNEQPSHGAQELPGELSQPQFDEEVQLELEVLLSLGEGKAEGGGGAKGKGEADEGEGESDDEGLYSGYESPVDPHPQPPRWRQTEDERDQDFDPNQEVGMQPLYHVKLPKALAITSANAFDLCRSLIDL